MSRRVMGWRRCCSGRGLEFSYALPPLAVRPEIRGLLTDGRLERMFREQLAAINRALGRGDSL